MHVLTGGAGFIGSCMLAKLNSQGVTNILVVDNLGSGDKWKNLRGKQFEDYLHKDEFLARLNGNRLPSEIESIIHLGACSSTTEQNAEYMISNNYLYSRTLAEWAISRGRRMIYASSAATYGDGALGFSDADNMTLRLSPLNIYGYSKQLMDLWTILPKRNSNRDLKADKLVGIKFFNVFGPNEYHKGDMLSVVYKAYQQIQKTGKVSLFKSYRPDFKDGEQKRDFIYVKDCCEVLWQLLNAPDINGIYNLGSGSARSWNDLVAAVFTALGKPAQIEYIEMPDVLRPRYQYFTEAKMDKLRNAGFNKSFTPLEDAVKDYVQNYIAQENPYL